MEIARYAIRHPVNVWLLILACLVGGVFAYFNLERLEDPEFTIKEAVVTTIYPGASAEQVEREVSDVLESAVQQLTQLKQVRAEAVPERNNPWPYVRRRGTQEPKRWWARLLG